MSYDPYASLKIRNARRAVVPRLRKYLMRLRQMDLARDRSSVERWHVVKALETLLELDAFGNEKDAGIGRVIVALAKDKLHNSIPPPVWAQVNDARQLEQLLGGFR